MLQNVFEGILKDFIHGIADDPETKEAVKDIIKDARDILMATRQTVEDTNE